MCVDCIGGMDSLLVLVSASLVSYKLFKSKKDRQLPAVVLQEPLGEAFVATATEQTIDAPPPDVLGADVQSEPAAVDIPSFLLNTRPATMSLPSVAETPIRRLAATDDDGTGVQEFDEHFFPQDSKSTGRFVVRSPWMRAVETSQNAPSRTERESVHPSAEHDRDDVRGTIIPGVVREREAQQAAQTLSKLKTFERPVTEEWTATGENRGLHPIKRYHKFLLSDQPVLELPEGPKGSFACGASKSATGRGLDNDRRELHVEQTGVPTSSFGIGIPRASFQLDPSNAEYWEIDKHVASASRGPAEAGGNTCLLQKSFTLKHDENFDFLDVTDKANLCTRNLPLSTTDAGSSVNFAKASCTLAHDEGLDLMVVTQNAGISKTHMPPASGDAVKASFTLAHDSGLDLQAVTSNCNRSKTNLPHGEGPGAAEMKTKDVRVAVPSVIGAKGGVRQKHKDKSSVVKSISQKEDIAASTQQMARTSGAKASRPSAASKSAEHQHADGRLAEEEGAKDASVRGAPLTRKAADTSRFQEKPSAGTNNQFSLDNSKDTINSTPFTSKNFTAPQSKTLPSGLRVAPTASLSLSQKEVSLKKGTDGLADMLSMGRNKAVPTVKTANLSEKEPDQKDQKLKSFVLSRTNRGVDVANPYSRPRPLLQ